MKLTEKQKRFCDYYIELGNATQAAIKAGYSERTAKETGYENLTKPHLKGYIDKRLEAMQNERTADAQEVIEFLTSVMRGEVKKGIYNVKVINDDGDVTSTKKEYDLTPQIEEQIKAAELIGKRYALFTDKVDLQSGDIVIKVGEWDGEDTEA